MTDSITAIVIKLIERTRPDTQVPQLEPQTSLLADGLLTSLAVVTLVSDLEARFNIRLPFKEIVKENFTDIASIEKMVLRNGAVVA
ncbi:MAG: hypothetical protein CBCREVIR_3757 [Candidatus Burkholderia crenata]|nr:MAG: hypothetical protein CBCREVIR_3757 [Candidatus Burkholderia crenata]